MAGLWSSKRIDRSNNDDDIYIFNYEFVNKFNYDDSIAKGCSMSLLNYQIYNTPGSHKVVMNNVRSFAVAQGWAQVSYKTGVVWGVVDTVDASSPPPTENEGDCYRLGIQTPVHSDWDGNVANAYVEFVSDTWVVTSKRYWFKPGVEDYLCLSSNGYGSQSLYYRFRIYATGSDPEAENIKIGAQKASQQTIDYTSSTRPIDQNDWIPTPGAGIPVWSLSPSPMIKQWCFGNSKIIVCCVQIDAVFCTHLIFGSPELFNTGDTEGDFLLFYGYYYAWHYYQTNPTYNALKSHGWLYGGADVDEKFSLGTYEAGITGSEAGVGLYHKAGNKNNWSGKRVMQKDLIYLRDSVDGVYFPIGVQPFFFIEFTGLAIGQTLSYGAEQYICLPLHYSRGVYPNVHGIAVRVV